jgi:hypothetical protein
LFYAVKHLLWLGTSIENERMINRAFCKLKLQQLENRQKELSI